jgi:hypothetical protein
MKNQANSNRKAYSASPPVVTPETGLKAGHCLRPAPSLLHGSIAAQNGESEMSKALRQKFVVHERTINRIRNEVNYR